MIGVVHRELPIVHDTVKLTQMSDEVYEIVSFCGFSRPAGEPIDVSEFG